MELPVYHKSGEETGRTVTLSAAFRIVPRNHVLWLDVRRTQAARRRGTHKTKERSEVRGSTRKLYRQKGTGMARAGSRMSPLRRGGGRAFGPRPRQYRVRLSKKAKRLAHASALSYKVQNERLLVVEALAFEVPSTKRLAGVVAAFEVSHMRVLVVTAEHAPAAYRSSSNLARVDVKEARNLCAEDVLRAGVLVVEEDAMAVLDQRLASLDVMAEPADP